jgi:hypothetical protein
MSTIESLEHSTGIVPLGSDPEHCRECRCVASGHGQPQTFGMADVETGRITTSWVHCPTCGDRPEPVPSDASLFLLPDSPSRASLALRDAGVFAKYALVPLVVGLALFFGINWLAGLAS